MVIFVFEGGFIVVLLLSLLAHEQKSDKLIFSFLEVMLFLFLVVVV